MTGPTANPTDTRRPGVPLPIRRVARLREPSIRLVPAGSAGRGALEASIAAMFARRYDARVGQFLPLLLSLNVSGQLGAVVGLRLAARSPLFLESYLDRPIEQKVAAAFGTPVDRAQIVEIGNLASVAPGAAGLLFGLLPRLLHGAGIRWVVCTATPQVRSMLDRLDYPTRGICRADAEALGHDARDWGSYYASRPEVIAGEVEQAAARAAANGRLDGLATALSTSIGAIGDSLRQALA